MFAAIALGLCVVFVAFFFWLHVSVESTVRRELQTLADAVCPSCGRAYGRTVAEQARRDYQTACDQARKARPDLRIDFARRWPLRCGACGAAAEFWFDKGTLGAPQP